MGNIPKLRETPKAHGTKSEAKALDGQVNPLGKVKIHEMLQWIIRSQVFKCCFGTYETGSETKWGWVVMKFNVLSYKKSGLSAKSTKKAMRKATRSLKEEKAKKIKQSPQLHFVPVADRGGAASFIECGYGGGKRGFCGMSFW